VRVESRLQKPPGFGFAEWLREAVVKGLLSRAAHYIVVSRELILPTATWLGRSTECFDFVPNPLVYEPSVGPESIEPAGPGSALRLLAVGRLAPEKNFSLAISVVDHLLKDSERDVTLQLFGEGPLREALEEQIVAANLTRNVFLRGFAEDKDAIYRAGDILIVTSHFEGSPLNVIEALSHGLSVISVDCDFGPREILTSEWLGLLASYDPKDIAEKVLVAAERFCTLDAANRRRQYAKSHFGLASIASQHETIFLSLSPEQGLRAT
jgi:glycosyltransferase involved in cell wall biosynthesis